MELRPGKRGTWHAHRVYREYVGRPLAADSVDIGEQAVSENLRRLCYRDETGWDDIRDEALRRYMRMHNDGRCTVEQWDAAVEKYTSGHAFHGKGSRLVCESFSGRQSNYYRISKKRLINLDSPNCALGRLFSRNDVKARLEKFKSYLAEKQREAAKKEKPRIHAVPDVRKTDRAIHTDAPWARFVRENSESAAHAIRARVQELLEPTIERHREEMDSAYLQALGQAFEEILEADREGAREEQRERVNAAA